MDQAHYKQVQTLIQQNLSISRFDLYYLGFFSQFTPTLNLQDVFTHISNIMRLYHDNLITSEEKIDLLIQMLLKKINIGMIECLTSQVCSDEEINPSSFFQKYFVQIFKIIRKYSKINKFEVFYLGNFHALCPSYKIGELFHHINNLRAIVTEDLIDEEDQIDLLLKMLNKKITENKHMKTGLNVPMDGFSPLKYPDFSYSRSDLSPRFSKEVSQVIEDEQEQEIVQEVVEQEELEVLEAYVERIEDDEENPEMIAQRNQQKIVSQITIKEELILGTYEDSQQDFEQRSPEYEGDQMEEEEEKVPEDQKEIQIEGVDRQNQVFKRKSLEKQFSFQHSVISGDSKNPSTKSGNILDAKEGNHDGSQNQMEEVEELWMEEQEEEEKSHEMQIEEEENIEQNVEEQPQVLVVSDSLENMPQQQEEIAYQEIAQERQEEEQQEARPLEEIVLESYEESMNNQEGQVQENPAEQVEVYQVEESQANEMEIEDINEQDQITTEKPAFMRMQTSTSLDSDILVSYPIPRSKAPRKENQVVEEEVKDEEETKENQEMLSLPNAQVEEERVSSSQSENSSEIQKLMAQLYPSNPNKDRGTMDDILNSLLQSSSGERDPSQPVQVQVQEENVEQFVIQNQVEEEIPNNEVSEPQQMIIESHQTQEDEKSHVEIQTHYPQQQMEEQPQEEQQQDVKNLLMIEDIKYVEVQGNEDRLYMEASQSNAFSQIPVKMEESEILRVLQANTQIDPTPEEFPENDVSRKAPSTASRSPSFDDPNAIDSNSRGFAMVRRSMSQIIKDSPNENVQEIENPQEEQEEQEDAANQNNSQSQSNQQEEKEANMEMFETQASYQGGLNTFEEENLARNLLEEMERERQGEVQGSPVRFEIEGQKEQEEEQEVEEGEKVHVEASVQNIVQDKDENAILNLLMEEEEESTKDSLVVVQKEDYQEMVFEDKKHDEDAIPQQEEEEKQQPEVHQNHEFQGLIETESHLKILEMDNRKILEEECEEIGQMECVEKTCEKQVIDSSTKCTLCDKALILKPIASLEVCTHIFHKDCLCEHFERRIENKSFPIMCPYKDCSNCLRLVDLMDFLDNQKQERYVSESLRDYVEKNEEVFCCPTPGCPFAFMKSYRSKRFKCSLCQKAYCMSCQTEWHQGLSCEENQTIIYKIEDGSTDENRAVGKFKQCPKSQHWVCKTLGTNYMKCTCGLSFCYKCGQNKSLGCHCLNTNFDVHPVVQPDLFHKILQSPPEFLSYAMQIQEQSNQQNNVSGGFLSPQRSFVKISASLS